MQYRCWLHELQLAKNVHEKHIQSCKEGGTQLPSLVNAMHLSRRENVNDMPFLSSIPLLQHEDLLQKPGRYMSKSRISAALCFIFIIYMKKLKYLFLNFKVNS